MKLTLIEKRPEVAGVTTFVFEASGPFHWTAGQYLHYVLPHKNPDDRGMERWFTISAAPFEGNIQITTRHFENGSTFKKELFAMPIGGTIESDSTEGDFTVPDPAQKMVFIAGGIGITPFRSILAELDHNGVAINAKLLYANQDSNFIFKPELEGFVQKHPGFTIHYFTGEERIDEKAIRTDVADLTSTIFYVSGPERMVEVYEKMLLGMGIPDAHIKRDYFPGYAFSQ